MFTYRINKYNDSITQLVHYSLSTDRMLSNALEIYFHIKTSCKMYEGEVMCRRIAKCQTMKPTTGIYHPPR